MLKTTLMEHRWRVLACSLLAAMAAGINIYLLDFLHDIAQQEQARPLVQWLPTYIGGVGLLFALSLTANLLLVFLACRLVAQMRESMVRKILASNYIHIEQAGKGPLLATMTDDVANMSEGMVMAPQFVFNAITVVLCLGYLAYLSGVVFLYFAGTLALGLVLTGFIVSRGNFFFERYRELKDEYYQNLHAMFDGAKELAISAQRRQHFLQREMLPSISNLREAELKREIYWNIGENWTRIFLFIGLGIAVVVTRGIADASVALTMSYFIVITFITGPIEFVINAFSALSKAVVSARAVAQLQLEPLPQTSAAEQARAALPQQWRELRFNAVQYTTKTAGTDESFHFGPVSMSIKRGEILFVTGGNGSGKSTFGKLLVGLYQAQAGQILLDDVALEQANNAQYCALFGTVFSDYYLFPALLDEHGALASSAPVEKGLSRLGLVQKVKFDQGYLSTTALSQGQRKRLALLQAWLQESPIYLFDEWAADQDPQFRDEFYREILPAMRAQGKTLVVISHDDRYFDLADRVCKFERGHLVSIENTAAARLVNEIAAAAPLTQANPALA